MAITTGLRGAVLTYTFVSCDIRYRPASERSLSQIVDSMVMGHVPFLDREFYTKDDNGNATYDIRGVVHEHCGVDQVKSVRNGVERDECISRNQRFKKDDQFENDRCANPLLMKALHYRTIMGG